MIRSPEPYDQLKNKRKRPHTCEIARFISIVRAPVPEAADITLASFAKGGLPAAFRLPAVPAIANLLETHPQSLLDGGSACESGSGGEFLASFCLPGRAQFRRRLPSSSRRPFLPFSSVRLVSVPPRFSRCREMSQGAWALVAGGELTGGCSRGAASNFLSIAHR
ncbi:unnamed protein product [Acanthosepion pharaonis]|uniref:Uncharacterized protein n=1 Tax=Acanthosepion pharaonis TaxID=158019 RepID=A0A812ARA3_ACAPH|nr:unnamed protein product [Sepia pharaonis]